MRSFAHGNLTTAGLLLTACTAAFGQYAPDSTERPPFTDVFVMWGAEGSGMALSSLDQWRALAPNSELLGRDLSDHHVPNERIHRDEGIVGFTASITRSFGRKAAPHSGARLRGGFVFQHQLGQLLALNKEVRTPWDTLTSAQTGAHYFIDSVTTSRYTFVHGYKRVGLDVSLIYLKQYPGRWSLYGGMGASVGLTFAGTLEATHSVTRSVEERDDDPWYSQWDDDGTTEEEVFSTADAASFGLYLPFGVGYRLGKSRPFWRALNLVHEFRPGLSFGGSPRIGSGLNTSMGVYFGLRVDLTQH